MSEEKMIVMNAALELGKGVLAGAEKGTLSDLMEPIISSSNDTAKLAAIFACLEILGPSDFSAHKNPEGTPLSVTYFLLEFNEDIEDDGLLSELYQSGSEDAESYFGVADFFLVLLNKAIGDMPLNERHEVITEVATNLALQVGDQDQCQVFSRVVGKAFQTNALNDFQEDVLDTLEFTWS